jgi:hypothetical protein
MVGFESLIRLMRTCEWCGNKARIRYCSVACQHKKQNDSRVQEWLRTGQGFPGTNKGHWMRTYVLEDQTHLCAICGCNEEHNGKPLVLVLDHINGDASNHTRENLRMICPNCDSQLDTYKGKNRGNGRRLRRTVYSL